MKYIYTYLFCFLTCLAFGQDSSYVCHTDEVELFSLDNINTKSIEFSPVYYQNGIVYVVAREKNKVIDPATGRAYFDLMYTDLGYGGTTAKSVNFSPNIRTQFHEGPCAFSSDGMELFFTRSNLKGGMVVNDDKNEVQLKIYTAIKGEEDWEQITELPFCNDAYAVAHPALSEDGAFLVFASNMEGGFGGMDLYMVNRQTGSWSEPVNLGPMINTKGNEIFPWFHPDGYLIFSSDGHPGKGGLDLFITLLNEGNQFSGLQHLESPYNSKKDDLGMIVSADGKSGYLASDRKPTKGKDDLYRWTSSRSIFCAPPKDPRIKREMLVIDEQGTPIRNAYVWLIPMDQDGPSLYKDNFETALVPDAKKQGDFYLQWAVTDTLSTETADAISNAEGKVILLADKKLDYIVVGQHNEYQPYVKIAVGKNMPSFITLKQIGQVEVAEAPKTKAPIPSGTVIVLDNIYYDFNKSAIRQGEASELVALANTLKQYPELTIELTSHTDTRGSADYNMELSKKRSESSKSYLVLLGVDASRIVTRAAGESSPRNKCVDDVPCTEAEHQYNRRTEVRIINPEKDMEIKYKTGNE
jgi:outer membrane protein OmpA-like peptidoglycan-associated protein/Tol biopolymer transport system component